ncbi:MAG: heavy metal sensor histidine kinase [Gammaproteobacteria bacterium]|nr:heavy metal sensor histidine kinase [Gammaproteobacteria bacterium]
MTNSLTTRLAWFYGLATAALLISISFLLFHVLMISLEHEDQQQLTQKLNTIKVILANQNHDYRALEQEVIHEGTDNLTSRILTGNGQVVMASPVLDTHLPISVFPQALNDQSHYLRYRTKTNTYLLASAAVKSLNDQTWIIQVAENTDSDDAVIQQYLKYLLLSVVVGSLLAMIIGYSVARRGLKPLVAVTQAAERITVTQLHERLNHEIWPTELQALARSFDAMLMRLEDSFQRLSQFSADIAHELRTPLHNLMGEAEVALARHRSEEEYRRVLSSSLEEYTRIAKMLDSLLFLARAEHAQMVVNTTLFDGRATINTLLLHHSNIAEEQSITLLAKGYGQVFADLELFSRAINNLLRNALRYTPPHGQIIVALEELEHATLITVQDSGCGIASEYLERLGERFYRAGAMDHQGSGLGLAIVRSIMDLHSGRMILTSQLGHGTMVRLFFPKPKMTDR